MIFLNVLKIISIPAVIIAAIIGLSCFVAFVQYLYHRFVKHEQYSFRYYLSREVFDRHLSYDVGLNDTRVIHKQTEMVHYLP